MKRVQNQWQNIWFSRELPTEEDIPENIQKKLLVLDGMDTGFGSVHVEDWQHYLSDILQLTDVDTESKVFEIGCGAGAFLYPIYCRNISVHGSDYSKKLVQYADKFMPHGNFHIAEATDAIPGQFSHVFSSGVFMYFASMGYAEKVLEKMFAAADNVIAILDIPDKHKQHEAEAARRQQYTGKDYEAHYAGLDHLYFEKDWFIEKLKNMGCREIEVKNQKINGYSNANYRFNVFARK